MLIEDAKFVYDGSPAVITNEKVDHYSMGLKYGGGKTVTGKRWADAPQFVRTMQSDIIHRKTGWLNESGNLYMDPWARGSIVMTSLGLMHNYVGADLKYLATRMTAFASTDTYYRLTHEQPYSHILCSDVLSTAKRLQGVSYQFDVFDSFERVMSELDDNKLADETLRFERWTMIEGSKLAPGTSQVHLIICVEEFEERDWTGCSIEYSQIVLPKIRRIVIGRRPTVPEQWTKANKYRSETVWSTNSASQAMQLVTALSLSDSKRALSTHATYGAKRSKYV